MSTLTLAIPEEIKEKMNKFPEINWSEVARQAFLQKIQDMEFLREFKSKSQITEKNALRLGQKVSEALGKKYKSGG